jgi:hypothetical protein
MAGGVVAVEAVLGWPTWEDGDGLGDNGSLKGVVETRSVVRCSRHDGDGIGRWQRSAMIGDRSRGGPDTWGCHGAWVNGKVVVGSGSGSDPLRRKRILGLIAKSFSNSTEKK